MSFAVSVRCPGCNTQVPLDIKTAWVVLDKPYCSEECANRHALNNTDSDCPVCMTRVVEVGRTGKRRCVNDHVWENRDGVPMYLRNLTSTEVDSLREQGLHA